MSTTQAALHSSAPNSAPPAHDAAHARRPERARVNRLASDDEILGLESSAGAQHAVPGDHAWPDIAHSSHSTAHGSALPNGSASPRNDAGRSSATPLRPADSEPSGDSSSATGHPAAEPENLRAAFDANPELRQAWQDAHSYRESFATPEEARAATALLGDLDRMDALFFSRRPEDHAELARAVAALDPDAFASLARAMSAHANTSGNVAQVFRPEGSRDAVTPKSLGSKDPSYIADTRTSVEAQGFSPAENGRAESRTALPEAVAKEGPPGRRLVEPGGSDASPQRQSSGPTSAQIEFFHAANAAAVKNVLDAIESQVERLLPEGVSKSARNRVVGEIYRELDSTLQSNRQLSQQMRDAFKSGAMDANHQRAVVSLITSRARQALPGVAKRVLNEWTSTVVAANHDRRARQRAAESRIDIAGSGRAGNDGIRPMTPRDIDYARLSDSDILNL